MGRGESFLKREERIMKIAKMIVVLGLIAAAGGCLSMRKAWESGNPLYAGQWRYADTVYSGVDRAAFKEALLRSSDVGLNPWPLEKNTADRIESKWVMMGEVRRRLEMRIDDSKDEKGKAGYLVSLRVLVQRTSEPYTPMRMDYHWENAGQDSDVEMLILAKLKDEMRQYGRSK